jgi:hypothetical protein
VRAAIGAARRGGLMVLASDGGAAHAAVRSYVGHRERHFHVAIADLPPGWDESDRIETISDPYDGPLGPARAVELAMSDAQTLWIEAVLDTNAAVADPSASMLRVENTAYVAAAKADLESAFASLGLYTADGLEATFPTLGCTTKVLPLEDWHYLEFNEPAGDGMMARLLKAIGRAGIFGLNVEPVDIDRFLASASAAGMEEDASPLQPLPVDVAGARHIADDVLVLPRRIAGGGRFFAIRPGAFPWQLLSHEPTTAGERQ